MSARFKFGEVLLLKEDKKNDPGQIQCETESRFSVQIHLDEDSVSEGWLHATDGWPVTLETDWLANRRFDLEVNVPEQEPQCWAINNLELIMGADGFLNSNIRFKCGIWRGKKSS